MGDALRELGSLAADGFSLAAAADVSQLQLHPPLFLPAGQVKAARRAAAERLQAELDRAAARRAAEAPPPPQPQLPLALAEARAQLAAAAADGGGEGERWALGGGAGAPPELRVLCRSLAQVDACLSHAPWLSEVGIDFLEQQGLREAVRRVQASGRRAVVATPRILKPGEEKLFAFYLRLRADALLVRSIGMLQALSEFSRGPGQPLPQLAPAGEDGPPAMPLLFGDFSLNAANVLTSARLLAAGAGLARLTPCHDMDAEQVASLARALGADAARRLEPIVHSHLPLFHTEHCVFARMLSDGNSVADCGQPCERHSLRLQAPSSEMHTVLADAGCRNTVFNGAPQSAGEYLAGWAAAGVGGLRVELLDETDGEEIGKLLDAYRRLAAAPPEAERQKLLRWLAARPGGATRGSLEPRAERARADMKQTAAAKRAAAAVSAA